MRLKEKKNLVQQKHPREGGEGERALKPMPDNGINHPSSPRYKKKKAEPTPSRRVSKCMMPSDGSDLMVRFVQGDDDAFEALMSLHENGILNFFYRLTRERYAAEDMTQELFLRVFNYRDTYSPQASFKSFLFRMARNLWIDRYRRKKVRPKEYSLQAPSPKSGNAERGAPSTERIQSEEQAPPDKAVHMERLEHLEKAVSRLPEKLREVVVLSLEGKMKYAEIAETLDVPVGTIKSRMHAAVSRLRAWMEEA